MANGIPPGVPEELENVQCDRCGKITSGFAEGQQYPTPRTDPPGPLVVAANEEGQVFFSNKEAADAGIDLEKVAEGSGEHRNPEHVRKYGFSHGPCPECFTKWLNGMHDFIEKGGRARDYKGL